MTRSLSSEAKALFGHLQNDVIDISHYWQIIQTLFMKQDTLELLNHTAASYFLVSQQAFADLLLLCITRITDPPQSRGQDNLVITRLLDHVDQSKDPAIYTELKSRIDNAIDRSKPFRDHRNKRVVHADLDIRMKSVPLSVPRIATQEIEEMVQSLQEVVNTFSRYFLDSETVFKIHEKGGVKALTTYLQKGWDAGKKEDDDAMKRLTP